MFKPTRDSILVSRVIDDTTKAGIILPEAKKGKSYHGDVIAIGDEVTDVAVGDHVYFTTIAGYEMRTDGEHFVVVRVEDVVAVVE